MALSNIRARSNQELILTLFINVFSRFRLFQNNKKAPSSSSSFASSGNYREGRSQKLQNDAWYVVLGEAHLHSTAGGSIPSLCF